MEFFLNALKNFDHYSTSIDFTYQEKRSFSTCLGGFCSLLVMVLLGSYTYYIITGLRDSLPIIKVIPYSSMIAPEIKLKPYYTNYSTLNGSEGIFAFAFGVREGSNLTKFDPTFYYPVFNYVERHENSVTGKTNKTQLGYKNVSFFPSVDNKSFEILQLNKTICPNVNTSLIGTYGDPGSKYLQLDFVRCKNGSIPNVTCANKSDIDNYINNITLELFIGTRMFNMTLKDNPTQPTLQQYHYNLMNTTRKIIEIKLSIDMVNSHDSYVPNFLYNPFITWYNLIVKEPEESIRAFVDTDNIVASFYIYPDREYKLYDRSYVNLIDKMYLIGGLETFFISLFSIFIYFYIKLRFEESMANDFFNIIDPAKEEFILKDYSVYLKHRYLRHIGYDKKEIDLEKQGELLQEEEILDQFFNRDRIYAIVGHYPHPLKNSSKNEENEQSKVKKGGLIENSKIMKEKDDSNRSNIELNNEKTRILEEGSNKEELPDVSKINNFEYYKNKIIYDVFKYQCFDKMYLSVWEVLLKTFCRCFANKKNKKRFEILDLALKKMFMEIDFHLLIKAVSELEKLQLVFLDHIQATLFQSFSSKSISYEHIEEEELNQTKLNLFKKSQNRFSSESEKSNLLSAMLFSKKDTQLLEDLHNFDEALNNMKMRGVSSMDRTLLENMGIDADIITNFSLGTQITINQNKKEEVFGNNNKSSKVSSDSTDFVNKVVSRFARKSKLFYKEE